MLLLFWKSWGYLIDLLIGVGFGAVLVLSGFGDSRSSLPVLFTEMRVLKVCSCIFGCNAFDFSLQFLRALYCENIWVNPTFLWSQIIGGLLWVWGFIIGGFLPRNFLVQLQL
jgi:hypothetical protein